MTHAATDRRTFLHQSLATTATLSALSFLQRNLYAAPAKKEWIQLFDGKSLTGWHKNPERIGHSHIQNRRYATGTPSQLADRPKSAALD